MTQFTLKCLALLFMLCDHLSKVVLSTGVLRPIIGAEADLWLRTALMVVGRIAFPIFAWFTAEACRKTRSMPKYLLRLFVFSVLSEIPFQLCFYDAETAGLTIACHNVMFTLLLAALAIYLGTVVEKYRRPKPLMLLPGIAAMVLGWLLHTDYNLWGVGLVLLLYYLPEDKLRLAFLGGWMTVFMLIWHGWNGQTLSWISSNDYGLIMEWLGGLFSVPLLACYNGDKGRNGKWLFYVFYPAHLGILYVISSFLR